MKTNNFYTYKTWRNFLKEQPTELQAVAKAVINQMGAICPDSLEELHAVSSSSCGAAGGYSGFIYYTDTVAFWRKNRKKLQP